MSGTPRIAISGLGVVGASGVGVGPLLNSLRAERPPLTEVDRTAGYHRKASSKRAALVGSVDLAAWIPPMVARRMSTPSRYAVAASHMALQDAEIAATDEPRPRAGVVVSTAFGPALHTQRLLNQIVLEGPQAASPALFTECVANAPAAQIAIRSKLRGPNHTIVGREAGILAAVGRAATEISRGRSDWMLAGGVEEMTPLLHSVLDRFQSLARERPDLGECGRPFDRCRDGFVAAEGACGLVLERHDHALGRGRRPSLHVRAWGSAFDPSAGQTSWGRGFERLAGSIRSSLVRFDLAPTDVDLVVSGASGSVAGDWLEARTLRALWGSARLPPVVAPKGVTGEYGGSFLAASVLLARGERFGGGVGFEEEDPDLGIAPASTSQIPEARRVLVTSFAAGGLTTWLVLER